MTKPITYTDLLYTMLDSCTEPKSMELTPLLPGVAAESTGAPAVGQHFKELRMEMP